MIEKYSRIKFYLQVLDFLLLFGAMLLAFYLRYETSIFGAGVHIPFSRFIIYIALLFFFPVFFKANNLYSKKIFMASLEQVIQILKAVFYLFLLYILVSFLFKWTLMVHSRSLLVMFSLFGITFLIFGRLFVFRSFYRFLTKEGLLQRKIIIIGAGKRGTDLLNKIKENPSSNTEVLCFFDDDPGRIGEKILDIPVLDLRSRLDTYLGKLKINIDGIYICKDFLSHDLLLELIEKCRQQGAPVYVNSGLFKVIADKVSVEEFEDFFTPAIHSSNRIYREFVKPLWDFIFAFMALFFLIPFLAPTALAIKLTSRGPVFYKRKAFGKDGKCFTQYKLRTMKVKSNPSIHQHFMEEMILRGKNCGDFKIKNDPRVTLAGRILRKLSLDELPQLYNVLKGDMSFIGPRPSLEYEFKMQRKWHKRRYTLLPGLSGLWQAFGRSSVSYDDMVIMDIYYEENLSFWLDLKIFFQTIPNLVLGKGAY